MSERWRRVERELQTEVRHIKGGPDPTNKSNKVNISNQDTEKTLVTCLSQNFCKCEPLSLNSWATLAQFSLNLP